MANFKLYPGLFVRITEDYKDLKKDTVLQVLNIRRWGAVTFVGVNGQYPIHMSGKWMEPVIKLTAAGD